MCKLRVPIDMKICLYGDLNPGDLRWSQKHYLPGHVPHTGYADVQADPYFHLEPKPITTEINPEDQGPRL